jgi:hypothetical protein
MSDDLVKRLRMKDEYLPLGHDGWDAADRIEELEAKLAKAVEALQTLKDWPAYRLLSSQEYAHNTLAELKGETDE